MRWMSRPPQSFRLSVRPRLPPRQEMTSCERSPGLIFPLGGVSSIHGYLIFSLNGERVKAD